MLRSWGGLVKLLATAVLVAGWLHTAFAKGEETFLDPEQAFALQVRAVDAKTLEVRFKVADGYYLYREKFAFAALPNTLTVLEPELPPGKVKFDQTFNKEVESYRGVLSFRLPLEGMASARGEARVTITSQGCADAGLCYPPMDSHVLVKGLSGGAGNSAGPLTVAMLTEQQAQAWASGGMGLPGGQREDLSMAAVLQSGRLLGIVSAFFVAGLLLAFTPCVLPMLPILSSVIVGPLGAAQVSRSRGFLLALAYSVGMALVYTAMGVAAGLAGEGLAATLQNPWVLSGFALLLVVMASSMFGLFEFQLPSALQTRLAQRSQRFSSGQYAGVFGMGALSALIVGPCVAAPLAGALIYIGQSRDAVLGALALFAMAAGMSVPLLLLGASAGRWLPRAGAWMEGVKRFFGVLLLAVAIWMVTPVLSLAAQMGLWAALLVGSGVALRALDSLPAGASGFQRVGKAVGVLCLLMGAAQLVGALSGGRDVLKPLAHLAGTASTTSISGAGALGATESAANPSGQPAFRYIKTLAELDAALQSTKRPVMLDFWAEWCVSCKEMERFTFSDAQVAAKLQQATLLKVDVTANNADDKALLKRFGLFGPPGIIFFDPQGQELTGVRVIGFQNAQRFLSSLQAAGL